MPNYSGIWTEQAVMQANGAGNWPNAPGAPTIGTATSLGATSVSVAFTAPTFLGLPAVITSYTVTSSPGGVTGTGASSPITVSGLTEGTPYTFTVTATNASGTSPASAASNSVTPVQINYVEEVFSTWLYTSTGGDITITNNIDLSTKGGLVWIKSRSNAFSHYLTDTVRGAGRVLYSDAVNGQSGVGGGGASAFSTTGYVDGNQNAAGITQVSWTFRKQPKFFDVVTYTGTGTTAQNINHNLGSVPGCIIIKRTDSTSDWGVVHRSTNAYANYGYAGGKLNTTGVVGQTVSEDTGIYYDNSTYFTVDEGSAYFNPNASGGTYVAYIFAHNAGGFGLSGTDNVISCGSYTGNNSTNNITLGYEPQFVLIKAAGGAFASGTPWLMMDTMRGLPGVTGIDARQLRANTSGAESGEADSRVTSTGFQVSGGFNNTNNADNTYIYIAIRRGPMKVPTLGTSVFSPVLTSSASETVNTVGFAPDMQLIKQTGNVVGTNAVDQLRGVSTRYQYNDGRYLLTSSTAEEASNFSTQYWNNTGFSTPFLTAGISTIYWTFRRAPGFMDVVCYTGNDVAGRNITHNLTVAPELMIVKNRIVTFGGGRDWNVYAAPIGNVNAGLYLNLANGASGSGGAWNGTVPTSSVFTVSANADVNYGGWTYVAYLFATCPGVSKVGGYTGTGVDGLQIDCGFTAGARFILIKRTDSANDWHVWDSARGITASSDPYLKLNTTGAQVAGDDIVDTYSAGFIVNAFNGVNANGGTYIFLAIA